MSKMVLLLLAAIWAAVLIPEFVRGRSGRRSGSMSPLTNKLAALDRSRTPMRAQVPVPRMARPLGSKRSPSPFAQPQSGTGLNLQRPVGRGLDRLRGVPQSRSEAAQRRRDVMVGLSALSVVTLLGAWMVSSLLLYAFLLSAMTLGAFASLVYQREQRELEVVRKVRPISVRHPAVGGPNLVARRAGGGGRTVGSTAPALVLTRQAN